MSARSSAMVFLLGVLLFGSSSSLFAAESGADLYKTYCWQCHGKSGDGMGVNVRDMSVQPRDHTDSKEMASRSDDDLFKAIKEGGQAISKSVLMPPWGRSLSDEDIWAVVRYLRELCQCQYGSS